MYNDVDEMYDDNRVCKVKIDDHVWLFFSAAHGAYLASGDLYGIKVIEEEIHIEDVEEVSQDANFMERRVIFPMPAVRGGAASKRDAAMENLHAMWDLQIWEQQQISQQISAQQQLQTTVDYVYLPPFISTVKLRAE